MGVKRGYRIEKAITGNTGNIRRGASDLFPGNHLRKAGGYNLQGGGRICHAGIIGLFGGRYLGIYLLKKYDSAIVYRYGAYLAIFVVILFVLIAIGVISGLWSFLIISGIFATLFGMMAPLGMKTSLSAFREVSGVAAALQSTTLFSASAIGSALIGILIHQFPGLSVEVVFAMVSALLCSIAALAALKNDNL